MERPKLAQEVIDNFIKKFSEIRAEASKNQPIVVGYDFGRPIPFIEHEHTIYARRDWIENYQSAYGIVVPPHQSIIRADDRLNNWEDMVEAYKNEFFNNLMSKSLLKFKKRARWRIRVKKIF